MAKGGRSTRIETKSRASVAVVRTEAIPTAPPGKVDITLSRSDAGSRRWSNSPWGVRGHRILPADFPLDKLDFNAPRGSYIDILV
jgi:hypothetical protein